VGWLDDFEMFSYVDKADGFNVGIKWLELLSFALFALLSSVNVHKIATLVTELCYWYKWSMISPSVLFQWMLLVHELIFSNVSCHWY